MITAKYSNKDAGTEYDRQQIAESVLVLGNEYEVEKIFVHGWSTEVFLKGHEISFNSVNFDIFEDGEELDYAHDRRFTVW